MNLRLKVLFAYLMRKLHKLLHLSQRELKLLIKAFFYIGWLRLAVLFLPIHWIIKFLRFIEGERATQNGIIPIEHIVFIRRTVQIAATYSPWKNTCLVQALTEALLLRKHNIPSTLYLGVVKDREKPERFSFHAWTQCTETKEKDCNQYTVLSSFAVLL